MYIFAAKLAAHFNAKARLWMEGRRHVFTVLEAYFKNNAAKVIWVHCASLGEFEQGRPVMEQLRQLYPSHRILLSFFSPSGYEVRKNYSGADLVCYLPADTKINAERFLTIVQPALVIFIKYEFWYYYLKAIHARNIPLLLVSAVFREGQPFFKWYGGFHRSMLACFNYLFVQDEASQALLATAGVQQNVIVSGDTRFDRVLEIAAGFEPVAFMEQFCAGRTVVVAGSTWIDDDEELDHYANTHPDMRFIIAPHDIISDRLNDCTRLYRHAALLSDYLAGSKEMPLFINTLIIDNIGLLSRLYSYATVCYVGGGFGGDGVHNVLEAAVYGKPVVFGPVYEKFKEAVALVETGGAYPVNNATQLEQVLDELLNNKNKYQKAAKYAYDFVRSHAGATQKVIGCIYEKRLLTN